MRYDDAQDKIESFDTRQDINLRVKNRGDEVKLRNNPHVLYETKTGTSSIPPLQLVSVIVASEMSRMRQEPHHLLECPDMTTILQGLFFFLFPNSWGSRNLVRYLGLFCSYDR